MTLLGTLRSLGEVGIECLVAPGFCEPDDVARDSRWFRELTLRPGVPSPVEDLEGYLDTLHIPRAVLLPCGDGAARAVSRLPSRLTSRFPTSLSDPASLHRIMDKAELADLLESLGVPHPETLRIDGPEDFDLIGEGVDREFFLKPTESEAFFHRFGLKAVRVRTREEAEEWLERIRGGDTTEVVLQRYIPGPASHHYFIDGFVDRKGTIAGLFARRRLRMYPRDFGNSSAVESVSTSEVNDGVEALKRIFAKVGYRGVFSAEFKRDDEDGSLKLLEINARAWWYIEFAMRCGVNVAEMAYHDALSHPVDRREGTRVGYVWIYPYFDFFALRELRAEGKSTIVSWVVSWLRAGQPLLRWGDVRPGLRQWGRWLRSAFRRESDDVDRVTRDLQPPR